MSARTIIRHADWLMSPETAPEAPPVIFEMQCTTCGDSSQAEEDFEVARTWAFTHAGRNPSHTGFREIVHRFWRATLEN